MRVHEVIQALTYWQKIKLVRTNDYGIEKLLFWGTKERLLEAFGLDGGELFVSLKYDVNGIETEKDTLVIKCQTEYFWKKDG